VIPRALNELIDEVLAETPFRDNAYFAALRGGTFDREDFIETQIQFYFAVAFFGRPMAAVAAKIPSAKLRVEILRNVWEEHGEGDEGITHGSTFLTLLNRLDGITQSDVEHRVLWPEVRLFNTMLTGACVIDDYLVGVSVMGMIERMFSEISGWIGTGIVESGWLRAEQMIHYNVHQALDVRHSEDFFAVLAQPFERDAGSRYLIAQGLRLGAFGFNRFYEDLFAARKRRMLLGVRTSPDVNDWGG
jgi:pyrroloquinoline-quinone synthase